DPAYGEPAAERMGGRGAGAERTPQGRRHRSAWPHADRRGPPPRRRLGSADVSRRRAPGPPERFADDPRRIPHPCRTFLPSGPPGAVGGNAATAAPHPLMEPETGGRALLDTRNRLTLYPAHIRQGDS